MSQSAASVVEPEPREVVLEVNDLSRSFGSHSVLDGVDLELREAENLVVLGRSGTGKSVLLRIIVGLLPPDSGEVRVFGQPVHQLRRRELDAMRRRIGFAFQHSALYDSMTVGDNVAFPYRINHAGASTREIDARVDEMLSAVGLRHTRSQMPSELSGGQRKRIGIARALVMNPELLLYDEPTAGLDPTTSAEINQLVLDVREEFRTSAIVITHDLVCARQVGDRVAMLAEGRVLVQGTFEEVFASEERQVREFHAYNFIEKGGPLAGA